MMKEGEEDRELRDLRQVVGGWKKRGEKGFNEGLK